MSNSTSRKDAKTQGKQQPKDSPGQTAGSGPGKSRGPVRAWLQLLRAPNLLTVPGDAIAGFLFARGADSSLPAFPLLLIPAAAVLLLYCYGLLTNDYFDLAEDRRDRPTRPLPAGEASPRAVVIAAILLGACGVTVACMGGVTMLLVATLLTSCIFIYNVGAKRLPGIGPLVMGSCRGLSLLLGAAFFPHALGSETVITCAIGLTAYIAAVTTIASGETTGRRVGAKALLPAGVLAAWVAAMWLVGGVRAADAIPAYALAAAVLLLAIVQGVTVAGQTAVAQVSAAVGKFIGLLMVVQAALVACSGSGRLEAVLIYVLVGLWIVRGPLARWFYSS